MQEKTFYKRIRQCLSLTQEDVARACDVNKKTVARVEAGTSKNTKVREWYKNAEKQLLSEIDG